MEQRLSFQLREQTVNFRDVIHFRFLGRSERFLAVAPKQFARPSGGLLGRPKGGDLIGPRSTRQKRNDLTANPRSARAALAQA